MSDVAGQTALAATGIGAATGRVEPAACDPVPVIPAQTMADNRGPGASQVLPMAPLFEGARFLTFKLPVRALRDHLGETAGTMRARHANLEQAGPGRRNGQSSRHGPGATYGLTVLRRDEHSYARAMPQGAGSCERR